MAPRLEYRNASKLKSIQMRKLRFFTGLILFLSGVLLCLAVLLGTAASTGVIVDWIAGPPQPGRHLGEAEIYVPLALQMAALALCFGLSSFFLCRILEIGSLALAATFANPLGIFVSVVLYSRVLLGFVTYSKDVLGLEVARGFYPSWQGEVNRLCVLAITTSVVAAWLGGRGARPRIMT
jgi:hypothetical protein